MRRELQAGERGSGRLVSQGNVSCIERLARPCEAFRPGGQVEEREPRSARSATASTKQLRLRILGKRQMDTPVCLWVAPEASQPEDFILETKSWRQRQVALLPHPPPPMRALLSLTAALSVLVAAVTGSQAQGLNGADWHLPLIGIPVHSPRSPRFHHVANSGQAKRSVLLTLTESSILAALNPRTGAIGAFGSRATSKTS